MRFPFRFPSKLTPVAGAVATSVLLAVAAPAAAGQVRRDTTRARPPAQQAERPAPQQGERPTAEMQQQMDMVGQMMQIMMQSLLTLLAKPETAEQMATFTRNYVDALVAKGFSREDAIRIAMAHGFPGMPTSR